MRFDLKTPCLETVINFFCPHRWRLKSWEKRQQPSNSLTTRKHKKGRKQVDCNDKLRGQYEYILCFYDFLLSGVVMSATFKKQTVCYYIGKSIHYYCAPMWEIYGQTESFNTHVGLQNNSFFNVQPALWFVGCLLVVGVLHDINIYLFLDKNERYCENVKR